MTDDRPRTTWLAAICLAALFAAPPAGAQTGRGQLSPAEKWVADKVTSGTAADLSQEIPNESDQRLSAQFLTDLLTGKLPGVTPQRLGVRISHAIIDEPVNLINAQIPWEVRLENCQFNRGVDFTRATFAGIVSFSDTIFKGPTDAAGYSLYDACFYGMKVGQDALFKRAVFEGPANFQVADIGGDFNSTDARFEYKMDYVWLGMKCGARGLFSGATFAGPVWLAESSFLDLIIGGTTAWAAPISTLDLTRGSIQRELRIQKVAVSDLNARSLQVAGPASLTDIAVSQAADLGDGNFATLDLSRSVWPADANAIHLQGMDYKYICKQSGSGTDETESHNNLLKLAEHSAFAVDVYVNLEAFFSRQGYSGDADRAFVAGQRRQRAESFRRGEYLSWIKGLFLDGLVGYGRYPSRAAIPCVFFVALGCFLFSADKMELQKKDDAARGYSPFWYSLGLFLPFVDLQADKVWKPKRIHTFLRNYMRVHILLGWILVPIVLLALTGVIK